MNLYYPNRLVGGFVLACRSCQAGNSNCAFLHSAQIVVNKNYIWKMNRLATSSAGAAASSSTETKEHNTVNITPMFGAVVGDIAGSYYEIHNIKSEDCVIFHGKSRLTDDSILTLATAHTFLTRETYCKAYQRWGKQYPDAGYGANFQHWLQRQNPKPYNSFGNGSAMRVSPVGWVANTLEEALHEATKSAQVTHNHPSGIKGAQAVAACVFLARLGKSKSEIKEFIERQFEYNLRRKLDGIRPTYKFDVSCDGSVPEAIIAFLESNDFEDSIRKAISLGGDSDTIACIAGSISHAYYKEIPDWMVKNCRHMMNEDQLDVMDEFWERWREGSLSCHPLSDR